MKRNLIRVSQPLESITHVFIHHKSIHRVTLANIRDNEGFRFSGIVKAEVKKDILNLSSRKSVLIIDDLRNLINNNCCLKKGIFHVELTADISPIFKRNNLYKENYGPVSILPNLSKVYERITYKQTDNFMSRKFSPYFYGFSKNHSSQYSLLIMIEIWKRCLERLEVVVQRCSVKKVFLDISQNSLENTSVRVSFLIKLQAWDLEKKRLCFDLQKKRLCPVIWMFCSRTLNNYFHTIFTNQQFD